MASLDHNELTVAVLNYFWGNIKCSFYFCVSFLLREVTLAVEILPHKTRNPPVPQSTSWLQVTPAPSQYKDHLSHVKDKMVMRPSYLWHGHPYTGKTTSLHYIEMPPGDISSHNTDSICLEYSSFTQAWMQWPPFCRHFQIHFLERKYLYLDWNYH